MKSMFRRLSLPHLAAVVAIALVLGSGSAYAAKQISGKNIKNNTVTTKDVKDASLSGTDVADGSLTSADILDGTITGADIVDSTITTTDVAVDTLTAADLANDSVTAGEIAPSAVDGSEIATDAVGASEVQNDSIDAGEIVDFGLTNQDIGVLYAQVAADGTLSNSSGAVTTTKVATGQYAVDFARDITDCAFTASVGPSNATTATGVADVSDRSSNVEAVLVQTHDFAGALVDRPFQLLVVC